MVLVDTCVWIRFLLGRFEEAEELSSLLRSRKVVGHDLVYGELLCGDRGGRLPVLTDYQLIRRVPTVSHEDVVELVRSRRLHGRGTGWVDIHLLASAIISGVQFWTVDPRLESLAQELGIAYNRARHSA